MGNSAFSRLHPGVNFCYFVGAIGFGVVLQHPLYLLAGLLCSLVFYLMLQGRRGWKLVFGTIPVFLLISLLNPLVNTRGETVLFTWLDRPYTLESLCYGFVLGAMFVGMMLWFGCYNVILTSDKFVCLFGSLIPSLSLLLVMVLRLIPSFMRKTRQITAARSAIGRGGEGAASMRDKAAAGMTVLSALTDWALEGSIVTADSMRSRGYGSTRRTSYQIYTMTIRDYLVLGLELVLAMIVLITAGEGAAAEFLPQITIANVNWGYGAYWGFLLIPIVMQWKEDVLWRILRSKI